MSGRKTSKRVLAFLLAFCMMATLLPGPAVKVSAAEPATTEEVVMQVPEESEAAEEPDGAEALGSTEEIVPEIPEKTGSAEETQPETEPDELLSLETAEGTKITAIDLTIPKEKLVISPICTNWDENRRIVGDIDVTSSGCTLGRINYLQHKQPDGSWYGIGGISDEKVSPSRIYAAQVFVYADKENGFFFDTTDYDSISIMVNGLSIPEIIDTSASNRSTVVMHVPVTVNTAQVVGSITVS